MGFTTSFYVLFSRACRINVSVFDRAIFGHVHHV